MTAIDIIKGDLKLNIPMWKHYCGYEGGYCARLTSGSIFYIYNKKNIVRFMGIEIEIDKKQHRKLYREIENHIKEHGLEF